jgi:hypothetical protein
MLRCEEVVNRFGDEFPLGGDRTESRAVRPRFSDGLEADQIQPVVTGS